MKIQPVTKDLTLANSDDVCPECKGMGWVLYVPSPDCLRDLYGDLDIYTEFAKKCPKCKGFNYDENNDTTGCPDNFHEACLNKFDFTIYKKDIQHIHKIANSLVFNFDEWKNNSKGIYLWSKTPGSGKSFLAACIAKSAMMKNNVRMKFITATDYIDKVSEGYTLRKQGCYDSPTEIYKECEILVLDDIGVQLNKEWQNQELFNLINERFSKPVVTIYTSNLPVDALNVMESIKSRIYGSSIVIQMPEESIRSKKAEEHQNAFLSRILKGDSNGNQN